MKKSIEQNSEIEVISLSDVSPDAVTYEDEYDFDEMKISRGIMSALSILSSREKGIVIKSLGLDGHTEQTYVDIGLEDGASNQAISRVGIRAFNRLRAVSHIDEIINGSRTVNVFDRDGQHFLPNEA